MYKLTCALLKSIVYTHLSICLHIHIHLYIYISIYIPIRKCRERSLERNKHIYDFPGDSDCKASACNVGDLGSIPVSGRSPGKGK